MDKDMEMVKEKILQWKLLAEVLVKEDHPAFIKELNGDLHFCDILLVGEDSVLIYNFAPEQRYGKKERIYWYSISTFEKFEEVRNG